MHSVTLRRLLSTASLLSFLACLLFGAASVLDGMKDERLVVATLACLLWSYVASVWAEDRIAIKPSATRRTTH